MQGLLDYAESFQGMPYIFGGPQWPTPSNGYFGFDCSGYVQEVLASIGQDPPGDQNAQTLFEHFSKYGMVYFKGHEPPHAHALGALAFFGENADNITHVGFITRVDPLRMMEAGGGTSKTRTIEDAVKADARIRMRPVHRRKDLIAIIRPHYLMMKGNFNVSTSR